MKNVRRTHYTGREIKKVKALIASGVRTREIARLTGRTSSAISQLKRKILAGVGGYEELVKRQTEFEELSPSIHTVPASTAAAPAPYDILIKYYAEVAGWNLPTEKKVAIFEALSR